MVYVPVMRYSENRARWVAVLLACSVAVAACGTPAPTRPERFMPVATVDEIMDGLVIPSSQALFDAVVYDNGVPTRAPASDQDWHALQMHALAVAEAANLLLVPPRAKEGDGWAEAANAMTRAGAAAAEAARAHDVEGLLKAGSDLYASCTACHRTYLPAEP